VPLDFLKRRGGDQGVPPPVVAAPSPPAGMPEEAVAQEFSLKLSYAAKTSEGVRMSQGPKVLADLPSLLAGLAKSEIEVIEPLEVDLTSAAPTIIRPVEAARWLEAHHERSPVARHALMVLESVDAIDLAFDTFVCTLLEGETDTAGYPDYGAIVGGVASHWDEATGDIIVRAVVGWGGRGARGDSDRVATRLVTEMLRNILASRYSLGTTQVERPVPAAGRGGLVCAHCGFSSGHDRAFYCPKCGMRMLRG
jgi:hypothetical protein